MAENEPVLTNEMVKWLNEVAIVCDDLDEYSSDAEDFSATQRRKLRRMYEALSAAVDGLRATDEPSVCQRHGYAGTCPICEAEGKSAAVKSSAFLDEKGLDAPTICNERMREQLYGKKR